MSILLLQLVIRGGPIEIIQLCGKYGTEIVNVEIVYLEDFLQTNIRIMGNAEECEVFSLDWQKET